MQIMVTCPIPGTDMQAGVAYEVPEKQGELYIENEWAYEIKEVEIFEPLPDFKPDVARVSKPKKVKYDTR